MASYFDKLLPYQIKHTEHMIKIFADNNVILDASDTGTGKTFTTCALFKHYNLKPLIICPKSVIHNWIRVSNLFEVDLYGVANYEMIKSEKMFDKNLNVSDCPILSQREIKFYYIVSTGEDFKTRLNAKDPVILSRHISFENAINEIKKKKILLSYIGRRNYWTRCQPYIYHRNIFPDENEHKCDYFTNEYENKIEDAIREKFNIESSNDKIEKKQYVFQKKDNQNIVIVFDEAHKCKNKTSQNAQLLFAAAHCSEIKKIMLSATIADKPECFETFGLVFGFYPKLVKSERWMKQQLLHVKCQLSEKNEIMTKDNQKALVLHKNLFPKKASRMKISELGDMFPDNKIISDSYYMHNHTEINKLYSEINDALRNLKTRENKAEALGRIIICRQRIEMLKIPIFLDLCEEAIDNGYSVAIFVNFKKTMKQLAMDLKTDCLIHGGQTIEERQYAIDSFQSNNKKIIICILQAGGVGISLHDIHGVPRMSIISPTWSGQDMIQCFGRIHRAGSKTPSIQKIVFCANTYEDRIAEIIRNKMSNVSAINDADLLGFDMVKEETEFLDVEVEKNVEVKKIIQNKRYIQTCKKT
jgi:superfamily II DNA or RNA helicase